MQEITVVGGGLTGLIAATECAEAGAPVRLLEARARLGGRAATTAGPYLANLGPHAFYRGPLWDWLRVRDLHRPFRVPSSPWIRFRWNDEIRRVPPREALRVLRIARHEAPVDRTLRDWMTEMADECTAQVVSGLGGVVTFDHDPGRLSAHFVWSRIKRFLIHQPPAARYVVGGWGAVADRLAAHARTVGARIEPGAKVERARDISSGPVIIAAEPRGARHLLDDDTLRPESPRTALLDLGLRRKDGGPYLVLDLDEAAFVNRFTAVDKTLAPAGHSLIQASVGLRPGEELGSGEARLEHIVDLAHPGWRDCTEWRRRAVVHESSGALDLPGTTWRDRTPIAYADGVWLAGDWVAAPGHLAEVGCASAIIAARGAVAALATARTPSARAV